MVRAVAQIEQELAALDQTVAALAQAFQQTYQQYLTALGQATRQQLILASYHICTRSYPEQFTALSLPQRQALQQTLRQMANQARTELVGCLTPISDNDWALLPAEHNPFGELEQEPDSTPDSASADASTSSQSEQTAPEPDAPAAPDAELSTEPGAESINAEHPFESAWTEIHQSTSEADQPSDSADSPPDLFQPADGEASGSSTEPDAAPPNSLASLSLLTKALTARLGAASQPSQSSGTASRLHPKMIAQWQSQLEAEVVEVLQTISHATNQALQQAGILPNRLPEPILEVAAKADLSSETAASPPNLLNLLVEADAEDEKSALTQVVAVRLRLSEIEFGDPATAAQRSKVRHLTAQLAKLGREYQRKQKERAVAEAEAAWRSSWYEGEA